MNSRFHQLSVEIAMNAMPSEFRERFLDGFSVELLKEYADVPYVATKFGEDEGLHLNHSYKLVLKGRDLHKVGDSTVLDDLVNLSNGAVSLAKQEKLNLVKYNIAKASHYLIDIMTFPHVSDAKWDKYHEKFESYAADWLESHRRIIEELVINYVPVPMRSVPNRVRALAEDAYFDALDFLPTLKRNALITDLQMATMCCKHVYAIMDFYSTFQKII